MKWKTETWSKKVARKEEWHKWFAWYPVSVKVEDGEIQWAWFESIYRRMKYSGNVEMSREYRVDLFEFLTADVTPLEQALEARAAKRRPPPSKTLLIG